MSGDSYTVHETEKDGILEIPVGKMVKQLGLVEDDEYKITLEREVEVVYHITMTKVVKKDEDN